MPKPSHYCPEWDFLLIHPNTPEMDVCICNIKGMKVPPVNTLSWIKPTELPQGHAEPCPMCGVIDDRDPSKNRIGSGRIRHDFINRNAKMVNKHLTLPGIAVVEYLCEVCDGTGEVWVNDQTGEKEPSEAPEQYSTPPKQYLTAPKIITPEPSPLGMVIGTCRGCHQITSINTDCYCEKC